jgi:hypothetical protein
MEAAINMINNQMWKDKKGWSSSFGLGWEANNSP